MYQKVRESLGTRKRFFNDIRGLLNSELAQELQAKMTFPVLEKHNYKIDRIAAIIECTNANLELSEYLEVPLGHPLLVYRHTA